MNFAEESVVTHEVHDRDMKNAFPKRKMFSSIPVGDAQHTEDDKDGGMRTVKAVGKAVSAKTGTLKKK